MSQLAYDALQACLNIEATRIDNKMRELLKDYPELDLDQKTWAILAYQGLSEKDVHGTEDILFKSQKRLFILLQEALEEAA